jgi:hypothetical protein
MPAVNLPARLGAGRLAINLSNERLRLWLRCVAGKEKTEAS